MKKAIFILGCSGCTVGIVWAIWLVGMLFELEYPYTFTLSSVRNATSISGVPASKIIRADGAKWGQHLHWHTCSYCGDSCGDHSNLICVQLEAPDKSTRYYFAYCRQTHTLVPMTYRTAAQFPALMPPGDHMQNVNQLNGIGGTMSVGYGDLELPVKWFRSMTHARPNGATNGSQSIRSGTNLLPPAAVPHRSS